MSEYTYSEKHLQILQDMNVKDRDAAQLLGVSISTVSRWRRLHGMPKLQKRYVGVDKYKKHALLAWLHTAGYTYAEISSAVGVSSGMIEDAVHKIQIAYDSNYGYGIDPDRINIRTAIKMYEEANVK